MSQSQKLTLHRELEKCDTTAWQRLGKRSSTYFWCVAMNSNVPVIHEMCLCINMLVLPSAFLPVRSFCDSSLEWHVQYRCHQVMTTTLDYPQWRLCWMSVTTKVLPDQTLLHGRHSVGGVAMATAHPPSVQSDLVYRVLLLVGAAAWKQALMPRGQRRAASDLNRNDHKRNKNSAS